MITNQQKPEAKASGNGDSLDVHSVFHTIQGEGPFAGRPAVFLRLAGCNLQCPFCDTEYTEGRETKPIATIVQEVMLCAHKHTTLVVITGGEPLRQSIGKLVTRLIRVGMHVQIESNGVFAPDETLALHLGQRDATLVISPKTKAVHEMAALRAKAFKYVLEAGLISPDDGLPIRALGHKAVPLVARPPSWYKGPIYVNPMDSHDPAKNAANIAATVASSLRFGHTLGLQIHKIIGVA